MWQQLNDLVVNDYADTPVVDRKSVASKAKGLAGPEFRAFDNETWNIGEWKKVLTRSSFGQGACPCPKTARSLLSRCAI